MRVFPLPRPASLGSASLFTWLLLYLIGAARANNDTQPISIFRSRPDLIAPICTIFTWEKELQAPGYYFVAPYQQLQESVHIFDNAGNLVWTGFGGAGPGICHAPQICNYKGEPHLCFYQGTQMTGWGHGHGVIMDKHYRIVKSVEPGSYQASSDMHEFRLLPDGKSALMTQYLRSVHNLCDYGICNGLGYLHQGAFQEVDVETGEVLFHWASLEHIDLDESYVLPSTTEISGSGEQPESPWDYFHINSIDKSDDGDYLVSARHVSAVYKISGKDGHVVWRLNGARSDFYLDDFQFSFQHDARWVSDSAAETIITLFDNGSNGFNRTQPWSTGLKISIDHRTKIAQLVQRFEPPALNGGRHVSKSQGNYQTLENGNVLLGWGNDAFWTEYTANGTVAFYGSVGWENVMNYRAHKFDHWIGLPLTKPALWTYSKTGSDEMMFYVSWNGATEVTQWVLRTAESKSGPWTKVAQVPKNGFETNFRLESASRFSYAEALDKHGQWLGSSEIQETYTPDETLRPFCDDLACKFVPTEDARRRQREKEEEEARKQREAQERKEQHRKRVKVLTGSIGGSIILLALLVFVATRSIVHRGLAHLRLQLADVIAGQERGKYRSLAMEEHEEGTSSALDDQHGTNRL